MTKELKAVWSELDSSQKPCEPLPLRDAVCEVIARMCTQELGEGLCAAVLTGSLARDEATIVWEGGRWKVLGDAEFLLIFHACAALPAAPRLKLLCEQIENILLQRQIVCPVSVSAVHSDYLSRMQPHIFGYELRTCGRVVWGESQILSLIPAFSPQDIPLEDGWRMLCNRMVELLEVAGRSIDSPGAPPWELYYRTTKFYLDMATSFLLFLGAYEPSYRKRAEKLRILADNTSAHNGSPFLPLRSFSAQVNAYTQIKLQEFGRGGMSATRGETNVGLTLLEEAVTYARLLWRWELTRLTGALDRLSDRELFEKWIELQPIGNRLRGWLYVLRKRRWHRSWREWPRWVRCGWRASPRYCVYAVASELFFRLPSLLGGGPEGRGLNPAVKGPSSTGALAPDAPGEPRSPSTLTNQKLQEIRSWLPVVPPLRAACAGLTRLDEIGKPGAMQPRAGLVSESEPGTGGTTWQQVASEIAWNYHEFLEATRA